MYEQILRAYNDVRHNPDFKISVFWRSIVRKLDLEISQNNLQRWIAKMGEREEAERDAVMRQMNEEALSPNASISTVRDASIRMFMEKMRFFLANPHMMKNMNMKDALQLFEKIEKLNAQDREWKRQAAREQEDDRFTVFSVQAMSGRVDMDDLAKIKAQVYAAKGNTGSSQ